MATTLSPKDIMSVYQKIPLEPGIEKLFEKYCLATPNNSTKKQILLVDDTLENLKLVTIFLNQYEFEVLTAKSGTHALKIMENASPDLI